MKRPKEFTDEMVKYYNAFVDASSAHKLLFEKVDVGIGEADEGIKGLRFEIDTSRGLTHEEAKKIFGDFIRLYPMCSINYTVREVTALEDALYRVSDTVMVLHEGFQLERISIE